MKKIAIIMEDMRLGGPQKQLIYFLNQIKDYQDLKKYYLILNK